MVMHSPEQRRTKRFELRLPIELVRAGSRRISEVGETRNLSSGGVLFTTDEEIEVGDPIEYIITLPSGVNDPEGARLHCVGKVVRLQSRQANSHPKQTTLAATLERYQFVRPKR